MIQIEAKLPDNNSKSVIMSKLWEMVMKVEAYLGLSGYLESRKEYFINKTAEIRRRDEKLRQKLKEQKNRKLAEKSVLRLDFTTDKRILFPTSPQGKPKKKRKWRFPWKKFFGFMLVLLALLVIHTNGRLVQQAIPDDIEAKILEFWDTMENSTEEVASTTVACSKADYSLEAALKCYLTIRMSSEP